MLNTLRRIRCLRGARQLLVLLLQVDAVFGIRQRTESLECVDVFDETDGGRTDIGQVAGSAD